MNNTYNDCFADTELQRRESLQIGRNMLLLLLYFLSSYHHTTSTSAGILGNHDVDAEAIAFAARRVE